MVAPRLSLEDALERVEEQENLLKERCQQDREHILEYPADMAVIEIFRAAIRCIPKNDPAVKPIEHLILDFEMKRLTVKATQLLHVVTSLRGALQSKVDKKNARTADGDIPNLRIPGGRSQPRHRDNPPTPPLAQYRPTIPARYKSEWSSSAWVDVAEENG
jgi:hypothetical protein